MGETYSLAEPIPVLNQLAGDARKWHLRHKTEGYRTDQGWYDGKPLELRADAAITLAIQLSVPCSESCQCHPLIAIDFIRERPDLATDLILRWLAERWDGQTDECPIHLEQLTIEEVTP